MFEKNRNQKGFTLLEVMVVIGIIGLLTAVTLVNFNEARKTARDKVRMADTKAIQLALELYKADNNGLYPPSGCGTAPRYWASPGPGNIYWYNECDEYIEGLAPDYIAELPEDPSREDEMNRGYFYAVTADRKDYKFMVTGTVEREFVESYDDEFARCPRDCDIAGHCDADTVNKLNYAVYSMGQSMQCS